MAQKQVIDEMQQQKLKNDDISVIVHSPLGQQLAGVAQNTNLGSCYDRHAATSDKFTTKYLIQRDLEDHRPGTE